MTDRAIVSDDMAKKFETENDLPYERWVRSEGLDIIPAHYVRNLRTVDLKPWASRGGEGVFINHEASRVFQRLLRLRNSRWRQTGAAPPNL